MDSAIKSINDVIKTARKYHVVLPEEKIRRAANYAEKKHAGQYRKSGEPYIEHPLRVANHIASWGLETNIIIAALLHDVVEDCDTPLSEIESIYGPEVATMVSCVTELQVDIEKAQEMTKEERDKISDANLIRNMNRPALLIKVADRIDNLSTIDCFPINKKLKKTEHTREILIPLVKKEGAYYLVDILECLCLRIEQPDKYKDIEEIYTKIRKENKFSSNILINYLKDTLSENYLRNNPELSSFSGLFKNFYCSPRSVASIYRQITRSSHVYSDDISKIITKEHVALYSFTIVIDESIKTDYSMFSTTDLFFKYYTELLLPHGICILGSFQTSYANSNFFILKDDMNNLYRLFITTEQEHLHYMVGDILEENGAFGLLDVNEIDPPSAYNPKIKVYKRDGQEMHIDKGATVLDFAYAIHTEIGNHFEYAIINELPEHHGAYRRLEEGDKIEIITSPDVEPQLKWFRYTMTVSARDKLISWFARKEKHISGS